MKRHPLILACVLSLCMISCGEDKSKEPGNTGGNDTPGNNDKPTVIAEATPCLIQMVEGCADIANEVGVTKIGEPYNYWLEGRQTEAVYAVESWYSWHSRDDYSNNILSIANVYAGSIKSTANINNGGITWDISSNSLASFVAANNPSLDTQIRTAINDAWVAIQSIAQPFRNHIDSRETIEAMEACSDLEDVLTNKLEPYIQTLTSDDDEKLNAIVDNFVDNVAVLTYSNLTTENTSLLLAVQELAAVLAGENPMSADFSAACNAWLQAREPWEKSEAFLFGPVDALGLDPNMDSWPLDQDEIVRILTSGNYDDLDWNDGDADDEIEAAQNVRGYHTLEFLLFKNGQPRTVLSSSDNNSAADLDVTPANAKAWSNYMIQVSLLLVKDSSDLYDAWTVSYEGGRPYASIFKSFDI